MSDSESSVMENTRERSCLETSRSLSMPMERIWGTKPSVEAVYQLPLKLLGEILFQVLLLYMNPRFILAVQRIFVFQF